MFGNETILENRQIQLKYFELNNKFVANVMAQSVENMFVPLILYIIASCASSYAGPIANVI